MQNNEKLHAFSKEEFGMRKPPNDAIIVAPFVQKQSKVALVIFGSKQPE